MSERSTSQAILDTLLEQKRNRVERGFYWENQIAFAYNSDKMEGSPLTPDQTRSIFETRTVTGRAVPTDFVIEAQNHFRLFDRMLETAHDPLTADLLKEYHQILKAGTSDDTDNASFAVGGWKTQPNTVAGLTTTSPKDVGAEIERLLEAYNSKQKKTYRDLAGFHVFFERIHPFQDGNGRVGRIVLFKECLANGLEPFIVLDEEKARYYAGLADFETQPDQLVGFFEDMRDLYMTEYSSLVPEKHLLPRFSEFARESEPLPIEDFFGEK